MNLFNFISFFNDIGISDTQIVGGKNSSLGEMYNNLSNIRIPNGFALTCEAYRYFINHNNLEPSIKNELEKLNNNNNVNDSIKKVGENIRNLIKEANFQTN